MVEVLYQKQCQWVFKSHVSGFFYEIIYNIYILFQNIIGDIVDTIKKEIVRKLLCQGVEPGNEEELLDLLVERPISIDIEKKEEQEITIGDKIADKVAELVGSWGFIISFALFLISWIIINSVILANEGVDPYPFILLNLMLSCISALQAPIIMMSQNRHAKKDSLRNQNDYQIDLKSELILEDLHDNIKKLIKNQNEILEYINNKK